MLALTIAAAEPDRTAFYIFGGLLAVWAVVLGLVGATQPAFPYGSRGARVVMLLSAVLVAAAMASAILTD